MDGSRYTRVAILSHWSIAALALIQILLGFAADWAQRSLSEQLLGHHVRVGILVFALMLLRISWRLGHRPPPLPEAVQPWRQRGAQMTHGGLYVLLVLLPVTGYVLWAWTAPSLDFWSIGQVPILFVGGESEFWRSVSGYIHEYGAYLFTVLVLAHIGAALHHHFVAKDIRIGDRMGFAALDEAGPAD